MTVQTTQTPRGYAPGNVAQAQDAAVFERSGAGVYLTMEWIAAYIQAALGNGSAISFGTVNPANTAGEQNDIFFNVITGEVLSKGASAWTTQANFALDTEVTAAIAAAITAHVGATDPHPIYLTQAEATALYKPLTTDDSVATGLRFALKTATTGTPGNGEIQFNNATLTGVTQLLISEVDRDGSTIPTLLDMLQQTTRIIIQVEQAEGLYVWFSITGAIVDNGAYRTVPVAFVTAPTGVTTVAGLGATAAELTLDFYGVGGSSSVVSGIKFNYNLATVVPAGYQQFRANSTDLAQATVLSFAATENHTNNPSVANILQRLKQNAIIEIRQSSTAFARYTVASDAVVDNTGSVTAYNVNVSGYQGGSSTVVSDSPVYLTIISDSPSVSSGGGSSIIVQDEGSLLGTATTINFAGAGVNSTFSGGIATVTIPGGGSGGGGGITYNETSVGAVSASMDTGYISNTPTNRQSFSTPSLVSGDLGKAIAIQGKGAAGFQLSGATFLFPDNTSNNGVRNVTTSGRNAHLTARCIDVAANTFVVYPTIGLELFTPSGGNAEATAVINALVGAGYTVPAAYQTGINDFYTATAALRSAVAREYGFLGGTAATHLINWQQPGTNNPTAVEPLSHTAAGVVSGNSGAINTGFIIPVANANNFAIAMYLTAAPGANTFLAGATRIGQGIAIRTNNSSGSVLPLASAAESFTGGITKGFIATSRLSSNSTVRRYVTQSSTGTTASSDPGSYFGDASSTIHFGTELNNGGLFGDGCSIGHAVIFNRGLTAAELQVYGDAVTALQTVFGRN